MKLDLKELLTKLTPKKTELLRVSSSLANTDYSLSDNISNYDIILVVGMSSYNNRWGTAIPVSVFRENTTQNYQIYLGAEPTIYNVAIKYKDDTKISVSAHGSATIGVVITGIKV